MRVRRGWYSHPEASPAILRAVRVGGRLACVSALRELGVFGFDTDTHVHLQHSASRLRSPDAAGRLIERRHLTLHWSPLIAPDGASECAVGIVDALAQAVRCQHPWHAVASLDSALHLGLVTTSDVARIFAALPPRFDRLRGLVDVRSEAGQESVLRCALIAQGLLVQPQVWFHGIGRVDLLVEECLVVEADSRSAHDGWALHIRDRDRDIDLARLGLMSLRPGYHRTMFATEDVVEAVVALVARSRSPR